MANLSFVILSREPAFNQALEQARDVEVRAHVEQLSELVETVDQERPDALLVSLDRNPEAVFDTLEKLLSPRPLLIFHGPDDSRFSSARTNSAAAMRCSSGSLSGWRAAYL